MLLLSVLVVIFFGDAETGDKGGKNDGRSFMTDETDTEDDVECDDGTTAILAPLDRNGGGN